MSPLSDERGSGQILYHVSFEHLVMSAGYAEDSLLIFVANMYILSNRSTRREGMRWVLLRPRRQRHRIIPHYLAARHHLA